MPFRPRPPGVRIQVMRIRTLGGSVVFVFALGCAAGATAQDAVPTPAPSTAAPTPAPQAAPAMPAASPPAGTPMVDTAQALDNIGKLVKDGRIGIEADLQQGKMPVI